MDNNKAVNTTDVQKITVGKMDFMIIDESPANIADDIKQQIESELFNVFKKYKDNNKD